MNMQVSEVAVSSKDLLHADFLKTALNSLDLEPIKAKLIHPRGGYGWSIEKADEVEKIYKQFLFLIWKYPDGTIVPTEEIDDFWHCHVLDTRKYFADCESLFGYYVHHFPYFGFRSEEDREDLEECFSKTAELFSEEFGTDLYSGVNGAAGCCAGCGYFETGGGRLGSLRPTVVRE
jgi:hypothetical protein